MFVFLKLFANEIVTWDIVAPRLLERVPISSFK